MTDTRTRARREKDEATLDLFTDSARPVSGEKADTPVATKSKKARKSKGEKAGPVAGAGRGGGGTPKGGGPAGASGDSIDMALFAERSYLTYAMSVVRGRA